MARWHNVQVTVEVMVKEEGCDSIMEDIPESVSKDARRQVSTALDGNGFWFTVLPRVKIVSSSVEKDG